MRVLPWNEEVRSFSQPSPHARLRSSCRPITQFLPGGFAMGIERLLALIEEEGCLTSLPTYPEVFVIHQGNGTLEMSIKLAEMLRDQGIRVLMYCGDGNFKNQMKRADQSQAHYALIIGENELTTGRYVFKPLRGQGEQQLLSQTELINFFNEK